MDLPSFLIGLLAALVVAFACVVAFRRRHHRRGTSLLILDPHTLAVEPDVSAYGHLPVLPPTPTTTTSQKADTSPVEPIATEPGTVSLVRPASSEKKV